jgi:hypothetical protein
VDYLATMLDEMNKEIWDFHSSEHDDAVFWCFGTM